MPGIETTLQGLLTNIEQLLFGLGATICVIGIIVGGLMRATAFGSERRIATSNVALSCAVVGFLIVLLAGSVAQGLDALIK